MISLNHLERLRRALLLGACSAGIAAVGDALASRAYAAPAPVACSALAASMQVSGGRILASDAVPAGQFAPPGDTAHYQVPAFCRVRGVATPAPHSTIMFEVWVPQSGWNGKLEVTGNGGYAGAIGYADMAGALARGYAAAGGDSGHEGPDGDLSFVVGHRARMVDWGYRSVHAVLAVARPILAAVTGRSAERAYYFGCSTGGGQGLAEVQRYPEDFDGIVIGAPGNDRTELNAYFLWMYAANHPHGVAAIPASKLPMITRAAIDQCDRQRGTQDGYYDSSACTFDPAKLLCSAADSPDCLTAPQLTALQAIYAGPFNPRTGERIFSGGNPSAEAGWANYIDGPEPARTDFWRYWVLGNPTWQWQSFDFDRDVTYAEDLIGPIVDNADPNLSRFEAHGGKIIEYQGESDPIAPVGDTLAYYRAVLTAQGSQERMDGFYRLFLAPGMAHCHGGPGPNVFGNQGTAPVRFDTENDVVTALDAWVTTGAAPSAVVASNVSDGKVTRSRPLCHFPQVAQYGGSGDRLSAASWKCVG